MPTLQVRDVPEHIYRRLAEQAERERRSLAQQAVAVLALGLDISMDAKSRRRQLLQDAYRSPAPNVQRLPNAAQLVRDDRQR